MRKGNLKSRSRRKGASTSPSSSSSSSELPSNSNLEDQPARNNGNVSGKDRRKPTQEEAALTAKNYRLAKELSELRVRHRDESKTVTRLTMENMNLASRCREAISHATLLKKELILQQRRVAEGIGIQKQKISSGADDGIAGIGSAVQDKYFFESTSVASSISAAAKLKEKLPKPQDQVAEDVLQPIFTAFQDEGYREHKQEKMRAFDSNPSPLHRGQIHQPVVQKDSLSSRQQKASVPRMQTKGNVNIAVSEPFQMNTETKFDVSSIKGKPGSGEKVERRKQGLLTQADAGTNSYRIGSSQSAELFSDNTSSRSSIRDSKRSKDSQLRFGFEGDGKNEDVISFSSVTGDTKLDSIDDDSIATDFSSSSSLFSDDLRTSRHSSIEAFDASFGATFPAFSTGTEELSSSPPGFSTQDFSDPFFTGNLKTVERNGRKFTENSQSVSDEIAKLSFGIEKEGEFSNESLDFPSFHLPKQNEESENVKGSVLKKLDRENAFNEIDGSSSTVDLFPFDSMPEPNMYRSGVNKNAVHESEQSTLNPKSPSSRSTPKNLPNNILKFSGTVKQLKQHEHMQKNENETNLSSDVAVVRSGIALQSSDLNFKQSSTSAIRRLHQRRAQEKVVKNSGEIKKSISSGGLARSSQGNFNEEGDQIPKKAMKKRNSLSASSRNEIGMSFKSSKGISAGKGISSPKRRFEKDDRVVQESESPNNSITERSPLASNSIISNSTDTETQSNSVQHPVIQDISPGDESQTPKSSLSEDGDTSSSFVEKEGHDIDIISDAAVRAPSSPESTAMHSNKLSTASSRRRGIRQPVSYAEPSLNSKLRRGDVYFPKRDRSSKKPVVLS